ncbi:MAG: TonB family protein [Gammaproteobacteria bacterium]
MSAVAHPATTATPFGAPPLDAARDEPSLGFTALLEEGIAPTLRKSAAPHAYDRLALAAFVALAAHGTVILGISFGKDDPRPSNIDMLDVVLVTHSGGEAPKDARLLAQSNTDGGTELPPANEQAATTAETPLLSASLQHAQAAAESGTAPPEANAQVDRPTPSRSDAPDQAPAEELPQAATIQPATAEPTEPVPVPKSAPVITHPRPDAEQVAKPTAQSRQAVNTPDPAPATPAVEPEADTARLSASALVSRSLAMASLSASVDDKLRAYSERPREKFITTRTREHAFAAYLDAWRTKVERIGNLNYPDEARRRRLSGRLTLDVALRPDGSIESIEVRRPSRHRVLDDAAVRIVKLAAPYARFPPGIASQVDVLHIVRTWVFSASNQFESGR